MKVTVKYFALLREAIGRSQEIVEVPETVVTVGELRIHLSNKDAVHKKAFASVKRIRAAINATMVQDMEVLMPDDEVAFFPPVTGG